MRLSLRSTNFKTRGSWTKTIGEPQPEAAGLDRMLVEDTKASSKAVVLSLSNALIP